MLLAIWIMAGSMDASAQTEDETPAETPVNKVQQMLEEQTSIYLYEIPSDILDNMDKKPEALRPSTVTKKVVKKAQSKTPFRMDGFRIQVFSDGRNPTTLQSRARARGNAIVAKFPKYRGQIYSFSSSPNWYTRIGNFKSSQEAAAALEELKRAFPSFAAEMRVVKSPITIIK